MAVKKINHISYISHDKRITYLSNIVQSTVTKLTSNEILLKYPCPILLEVQTNTNFTNKIKDCSREFQNFDYLCKALHVHLKLKTKFMHIIMLFS